MKISRLAAFIFNEKIIRLKDYNNQWRSTVFMLHRKKACLLAQQIGRRIDQMIIDALNANTEHTDALEFNFSTGWPNVF